MRRSLVSALRARGVDVITALDAEMIERNDAEHLDYATQQGRVLCTFNVGDFRSIRVLLDKGDIGCPESTAQDYLNQSQRRY